MSVRIELHIDGEVYPLTKFSWGFSQGTNDNGMPSNKIRQKGIRISTVMVRSDELEAWAYHNNLKKDFEIHIIPNILGAERTRIIKCYECFLIELNTEYHHQSKQQTTQHMFITVGRIETNWSTAVYRENWAQEPNTAEVITSTELEPEIISLRYTDLKENPIDELYEDKLILEIRTENCIGKLVDIDLSDDEFDFKYNGVHLKDDILRDLEITADIQRIELEVFDQEDEEASATQNEAPQTTTSKNN